MRRTFRLVHEIANFVRVATITVGLGLIGSSSALAQDYPSRPVRFIVPFAPGGVVDTVGRAVADRLASQLGQPVVVENRAGASGNLGTEAVAKSAPDGYTLLAAFDGTMVINPHVYARPGFDPLRDFAFVSKIGNSTQILVANPSVPAATLTELIAKARTLPSLAYGTSGTASPGHVSGEMLRQQARLDLVHVPYKGGGQAISDVVGGQIPLVFTAVATAQPFIRSGKLKGLAVTTSRRATQLPDVQTFVEAGLNDFVVDTWIGVAAPAKTPPAIVDRLHRAVVASLAQPELRERLLGLGVEPVGEGPEKFEAQIRNDFARWGKVIKSADIRLEQ